MEVSGIVASSTSTPKTACSATCGNVKESKESDKLSAAIDRNTDTTKICAYTALGVSCASLIPLTVLALKSRKISKVVDSINNEVTPVVKGVHNIVDDGSALMAKMNLGATVGLAALRSLPDKIEMKDVKVLAENFLNKIDVESINNLIKNLQSKIGELDLKSIVSDIVAAISSKKV